ncbi:MAG TPA: VanZ family protein [Candidatus Onthocola stercoravium]|nr:VanZ family protein [Candidatus Onthocola stercoravium]
MNYLSIIKIALITFPFIAFLITLPYVLKEYHKYGSVYWYRALIIYSFILYLLTAYFLVILPLPSREEVMALTTPTTQLIPFNFITDFINNSGFVLNDFSTYITALKSSQFIVPVFNIILTIPFGAYLHYYFKFSFKRTVLWSFLLSLFFELTQVTGLYFIYPRGYRLFDVDDLILNTFGGLVGYFVGSLLLKFLPDREEIDDIAKALGRKVSIIRRSLAYCLDWFIATIIFVIINTIFNFSTNFSYYLIFMVAYFILLPYLFKGQTLGCKFLKIKIVSNKSKKLSLFQMILRTALFYLGYVGLPIILLIICSNIISYLSDTILVYSVLLVLLFIFIYYVICFFKLAVSKKIFYEKWSKTRMISTTAEVIVETNDVDDKEKNE